MAAREQSGTQIDPGIIARVVEGVRYAVSGVTPQSWFGPQQPLPPVAQEQAEGRSFDYPVGYNLRIRPRDGEPVSFAQLRGLADSYDLLRLVLETRKDQIESYEWEIVPLDRKASGEMQGEIKAVSDFLQRPDQEHDWAQWLRMVIEELLVIDAVCVYPRMSKGKKLYGLELVDGGTIKRVIDEGGRTPLPPDPAYQQVLKGIPAVDYTSDSLVYVMRNPRVSRLYGYSPVEQVITTVNIALRRQLSQMEFYTSGNVPEALVQAPESWTVKQIREFQEWWDSIMSGNLAERRKMKFIPGIKEVYFPKEALLKDEFDEWLAKIVCFAFSISPAALIKQVNRASGEQMEDTAKEQGLMPLLRFIESFVTRLIQRYLGQPNLKFAFKVVNRVAPDQQAAIHKIYVETEVLTPDEVRDDLGRDAMTPEAREKAFPTPPAPGMGPDGKPLAPAVAAPKAKAPEPTTGEKILGGALEKALGFLDPEAVLKVAQALRPQIVEIRPDVSVEVGDTNVHVPAPVVHVEQPPAPLAKSAPPVLTMVRTRRMADGSITSIPEPIDAA